MYDVENDRTGAGEQRPRFSPLKMVARALGGRPIGPATPEPQAPVASRTEAPPPIPMPATRADASPTIAGGEDFLAVVNAMLALDDELRMEPDDTDFDLVSLIGEAHDAFAAAAERQGVTLALAVAPGAPGLYRGDAPRLRQALLNLIAGALKATTEDLLELTAGWNDGAVTLSLSGAEASAAMARVLADPKPPTARRPAAYRLALARTSALALGGEVRATPAHGVEIAVPLRRVADARPALAPAAAPRASLSPELPSAPSLPAFAPGLRVLVAEENATHRQMLAALLDGMGLEPVVVADGQAVVAAWREERWDALLIDIEGETVFGRGVAQSIRDAEAKARWPRMPILALAANLTARDLDEDFAEVIDGLVAKPVHAAGLHRAIDEVLGAAPAAPAAKSWVA